MAKHLYVPDGPSWDPYCKTCGKQLDHDDHVVPRDPPPSPLDVYQFDLLADLPETPYDGGTSSGWSGSATSHERALAADADGTTALRQRQVVEALARAGVDGMTAQEVCRHYDLPTNSIAPSLTILHKEGHIARLTQRRGRHEIYVLPHHVNGRDTAEQGRGPNVTVEEARALEAVEMCLDSEDDTISLEQYYGEVNAVCTALRRIGRFP